MTENHSKLEKLFSFLGPKWAKRAAHLLRFGTSSFIATIVDFSLYTVLHKQFGMSISMAHVFSASAGMLTNFFLQRYFVFRLRRQVGSAFLLSILVSLVGLGLGYVMMRGLETIAWFEDNKIVAKILVTAVLFGYNFFLKRFAFERRLTDK
jgi:putative flippase GtrA